MNRQDEKIIDAKVEPVVDAASTPARGGLGWKAPLLILICVAMVFGAVESWPRLAPHLTTMLDRLMQPDGGKTPDVIKPVERPTEPIAAPMLRAEKPVEAAPPVDELELKLANALRRIETFDAELKRISGLQEQMQAHVDALAAMEARVSAAEHRAEDTERKLAELAERRASGEAQAAAQALAMVRLRMAALAGNGFGSELLALERLDLTDTDLIKGLKDMAATGAPVLSKLQAQFSLLARDALKAVARNAAEGAWERFLARLQTLVFIRRTGEAEGNEPDAIIARMEMKLRSNDLAGTLAEAANLKGPARDVLQGWIDAAANRLKLEGALAELEARTLARLGGQ